MVAATQEPLRGTAPIFISRSYDKLDRESLSLRKLIDFIGKCIKINE